ncbi:MAG: class I SAM-dependent methyltransferase [Anaerolineales bacterium]
MPPSGRLGISRDLFAARSLVCGEAYEPYVGRWSRLVARRFIEWRSLPAESSWIDVGCDTGALVQTILDAARPRHIIAIDSSAGYVAFAAGRIHDPKAEFMVGDAQRLDQDEGSLDAAVSGLVLNFLPRPERGAAEMARVLKPGGVAAEYVWDYAGRMEMMRAFWDAAAEHDPSARALDEGVRFAICRPSPLRALWEGAGLEGVETQPIDVETRFRDFDDFWSPFLGGQAPAPSYAMSLDGAARARLRESIRSRLSPDADGSIRLTARAWAVRGRKPLPGP